MGEEGWEWVGKDGRGMGGGWVGMGWVGMGWVGMGRKGWKQQNTIHLVLNVRSKTSTTATRRRCLSTPGLLKEVCCSAPKRSVYIYSVSRHTSPRPAGRCSSIDIGGRPLRRAANRGHSLWDSL